jgi:hypothetical protein
MAIVKAKMVDFFNLKRPVPASEKQNGDSGKGQLMKTSQNMGWVMGLEPMTSGITIRRSTD